MSRRGLLLFAAMCVIWGIPYLFIRVAVGELTPATLVFLRTGVAALILMPFVLRRGGFGGGGGRRGAPVAVAARGGGRPLVFFFRGRPPHPTARARPPLCSASPVW